MVLAVETGLRHAHARRGGGLFEGDAGLEPGPQRDDVTDTERSQRAATIGQWKALDPGHELHQLVGNEWGSSEGTFVAAGVLEVALHAHRAEEEEADVGRPPALHRDRVPEPTPT